jgi:hypothetical protein
LKIAIDKADAPTSDIEYFQYCALMQQRKPFFSTTNAAIGMVDSAPESYISCGGGAPDV